MASYIALLHPAEEGGYWVEFPDFPGCATQGDTLDEARAMAEDALAGHVELMLEEGEALPAPASLQDLMRRPEARGAVAVVVSAPESPARTVRVSITLPEDDLKAIDAFAKARGHSRSAFLVRSARQAMVR
jgi:predicted RNase H-like HicB family nuclease